MSGPDPGAHPAGLPTGTLTFFRSDVEGSMDLLRHLGAEYDELDGRHRAIVRDAISRRGGTIVRTEGDAFFAVFTDALAAASAAVDIQHAMAEHPWPEGGAFKLRIGLHAGVAHRAGDDYGGLAVSQAARIADLGWGGQIVLSDAARGLIAGRLPDGWTIRDLGPHRSKGRSDPERIAQLEAPRLASAFPPLRRGSDAAGHLPRRMTSLVGRETELEALEGLLERTRLLTLTGPGGSGKTTLAIELARRQAARWRDGAWFVDLQWTRHPDQLRSALARGLGLLDGAAGPAADRLLDWVADRELLILLDNFEQLVDAAASVQALLETSSRSRIIVTSRIPLRLAAEQEYEVHPLQLEAPHGEPLSQAARLFIDRARRVRPGLPVPASDLRSIEGICRLVDGLPLAIELSAARVSALPVGLIHDRLRARLPLPGDGPRDLPERQRTVEAMVAWSHDLLGPPLQRLYVRLGAFSGSFDLEQAAAVCGPTDELGIDVLDGVYRLVEHSLCFRVDDAVGGARFGMLETIRAYARARLEASGEADLIRDRHMHAFAALAASASEHLESAQKGRWVARLEADAANLWEATRYAIEQRVTQTALGLVGDLWRLWLAVGRLDEARQAIHAALALPGAGDVTPARIRALDAAGSVAYWASDQEAARPCYEEQLALAQELGDRRAQAAAWLNLTFNRFCSGDAEGAGAALEAGRRLSEDIGDDTLEAAFASAEGLMLMMLASREPQVYLPRLEALAERLASGPDLWTRTAGYNYRAIVALFRGGDVVETGRSAVDAIRGNMELRNPADACLTVWGGVAVLASADPEGGAVLHGAAEAAFERYGVRPPAPIDSIGLSDPVPSMFESLGSERFRAAVERGRRMSLEDAADFIEARIRRVVEQPA